jgi:hypothetical protein
MYVNRILGMTALALTIVPFGAFAEDSDEPPATFSERYPVEQILSQQVISKPAKTNKEQNGSAMARSTSPNRPRSRVVVAPRSFLDAGTEVQPGERKFMDYADPPGYQPYNVVTNIGGRVGWHRSPLPGPFFPW